MRKRAQTILAALLIFVGAPYAIAQEGFELESDLSFADSEAAIVEADEAKERRDEEQRLQRQAEAEAKRQMQEAKRVEADAKKRLAQLEREEAQAKAAKEKAEAETAKALKRQENARSQVAAAELSLQEAERLRDEASRVKENEIETHRILVEQKKQIDQQIKDRKAEHIALIRDTERAKQQVKSLELKTQVALSSHESDRRAFQSELAKQRQEMFRLAERVNQMEAKLSQGAAVSLVAQPVARAQQGALKAKRNCNVRARPSTAANVVRQVSSGTQVQARRVDSKWVQLIGAGQEYMAVSCFQ